MFLLNRDSVKFQVISIAVLLFMGCRSTAPLITNNATIDSSKDIVIFIDGTSNTPKDNTNINKLRNRARVSDSLDTFYTVGVGGGKDFKLTGLAFGVGVKRDVVEAYDFLTKRYQHNRGDRIHLFGFSRGAYTCQVLSDFIYTVGMIDLEKPIDSVKKMRLIKKMYRAYRSNITHTERQRRVQSALKKWEAKNGQKITVTPNITITNLGMFDNVEALAAPDYKEKFCKPNPSHLNQFVNIDKVYHAVALDDNRAQIFTPILASCNNIKLRRGKTLDDVVNEVWFSGAHTDVGGGYLDNFEISYVSLDWMINVLKANHFDLFEDVEITDENIEGTIHDSEDTILGIFYRRRNRDIPLYLSENGENYNNGQLNVHSSVIKRLERGLLPEFKKMKKDSLDWFDKEPFKKCFDSLEGKRLFKKPCDVIKVVD
ncbi:MAG: DUF2235 domain-containing protein [Winogradskyella sp.]|uniref:phospholipase effector Tle1 domain-containing protein n=1 Tax=Winogradskyella sp. TaxID=1883156 RepID=UPI000F3BF34C|nr:DUF2235 domain-containing protein [Winogradskyella sp.]RNC83474.1 MAG: DUF2235 domain-containing protein [Winogradskyella sp.]